MEEVVNVLRMRVPNVTSGETALEDSTDFLSSVGPLSSADGSGDGNNPYVLPWWLQVTWATTFGAMMSVAILGNAIVIWAVLCHRVMRTPTNYFLVNVSVADFMMATFNAIFNFIFMLNSDWPFGDLYCTFNNFMANVTVAASVLSLTAISVDRYTAIIKPLKPRMSRRMAGVIIVNIWLIGSLLSLPNLLYSTTAVYMYHDGSLRTLCYLQWPDGPSFSSNREYIYTVIILIMTYLLPVTAMSIAYLRMGRELWGSKGIGECCDRQVGNIKSKRRIVRMFIVVVTMFAVCWLPYHLYFIYIPLNTEVTQTDYIQHVYLGFYWLAMSNACYNPIIYFKMNARFRRYFLTVLRCCRPLPGGQPTSANSYGGQSGATNQFSMCERISIFRKLSDKTQMNGGSEHLTPKSIHCNLLCVGAKENSLDFPIKEENGNTVVRAPNGGQNGDVGKWLSIRKNSSNNPPSVVL